MYLPIFGGERYIYAIQKIESKKVGRTWLEVMHLRLRSAGRATLKS